jgi:hypothetical protein
LSHGLNAKLVKEFCLSCDWAYACTRIHRTLFDDNPKFEAVKSGSHASFLKRLNVITQEYGLQQIAKLHDRGSQSLTVDYIVRSGKWDEPTRAKLDALAANLRVLADMIRPARDKVLAHSDRKAVLDGGVLGEFPPDADVEYFRSLQELVNVVHDATIGGEFPFDDSPERDAEGFRKLLAERSVA